MPRERWGYSRSHGQALSATLHHHCPTGRTTPEHTNTYDGPAAYHRGSAGRLPPESTFLGQSSPMALHHQGPTGCAPPEQTFDPRGHSRGELLGGSPRRAGSVPPVGGTGGYALRESGGNATARWGSPIASYEDFRDSQASLADMARAKYDAGASSPEREDFVRATLETMLGQANVDVRSPAAGENLERERRRLVAMPGHSIFSFDDVFNRISSGKPAFSLEDLRVAYVKYGISISEHELALLLHRYAPHGEVTFPDFLRQVKPRFY